MEVLHYIMKLHLRNFISHQWYILLLLYIQMSRYNTAVLAQAADPQRSSLNSESSAMQNCSVSLMQSCPCNSTGLYCTGLSLPLTEVPDVTVKTITHLDLTGNAISRLENASFLELEFLVTLCLGNNQINFIDPQAFSNLYRLETLNLENNEITSLDPSGLTFQHLVSLKLLNLQDNKITKVNKYSFFTMAAFSTTPATINLENNPILCDCDVWALKQWRQTREVNRVVIKLNCSDINRSYLEVPESTFGSCNASTDGIFSDETLCPICVNEGTNSRCNLQGPSLCPPVVLQAVCHKTVTWNPSSNKLALSSGCISYESCLVQEVNNRNTCGFNFQANKSVACNFCCKGPTCGTESIGGRTRDFTFYLSFHAEIAPAILNQFNSTTSEQIGSAYEGIVGGIDGSIYAIVQQGIKSYRIVLQLHVTTLSTISEMSILETLNSDVINLTNASHIYNPERVTVTPYFEGLDCLVPNDTCPANMMCITCKDEQTRCLCDNSSFYLSTAKTCSPLTMLQVKNVSVTSTTTDSVTLNWTAATYGTNVSYIVRKDKKQSTISSVTTSGAIISGLDPGTEYNFTIISMLTTLFYERLTEVSLTGVWTKATHGSTCDPSAPPSGNSCTGNNIQCLSAKDGSNRCLCSSGFYYSTSSGCRDVNELQVKNVTASSSHDTVTLWYTTDKHGTNVTYMVKSSPNKGHVVRDSVTGKGAQWTGLDPGTMYNFTVISILPATNLYMAKNISSEVISIWTKSVHGMTCGTDTCATDLSCLQALDDRRRCLCNNTAFYFTSSKACLPVNKLLVKNLNAPSITNDTVTLSWTADKYGRNVTYRIEIQPHTGYEVPGSVSTHGGKWAGLYPGMQYNFSVTSVLPADDFYRELTVVSQVLSVRTKELKNVTVIISYIKQDAEFLPFMLNSSSQEYQKEAKRIISGITAILVKVVDVVYARLLQFTPVSYKQYKVDVTVELTTFDTDTIGQVLNNILQNNTQDPNGFFNKEHLSTLDMAVQNTETINSHKCPYSLTSLDKGGIRWNEADVGIHYSPCPYNNPLDHPMPVASRNCSVDDNQLHVWGEVNASLCLTKEAANKPNILEVFERNITKGNAKVASDYLRMITNSSGNLTAEMMHKSVSLLETLTKDEILQEPGVATNVIDCISNLINVNVKTLQQSETETSVSTRLLKVIDSVANKAPLTNGKLDISTPNLAVAALKLDVTETRDITMVTSPDTGNENNVTVDISKKDNPQLTNTTSLMIPVVALINSMSDEQKQNLNRISFTVHRSDILFSVIKSSGNTQRPNNDEDNDNQVRNTGSYRNDNETIKNESYTLVTKVNCHVVSASVPGVKVENLSRNITMNFKHSNNISENARCMFWDGKLSHGRGDWSDAGCGIVTSDSQSTTCGCNHLTNFALLMDVYEQGSKLSALDRQILSIISYVGCGISCVALLITLLTYSVFKQVTQYSLSDHAQPKRKLRRDNPSKILINLCLALLCSNLVFLLGMQDYSFGNIASCKAVAVLLHYFLLASLTWMAVEAFYMYLALVVVFKTYYTNFILKCSLVGWGVPLVIVIITLGVNKTDNYGFINSGMCWLKNPAFYAAFVGPVCLILLINCMAFILVVKQLASMSSVRLNKTERNSTVQRLRGAVGVVILLGLSWIFAIFAIDQASVAFYYLFAIFNSLQGLFIFIFYCLLKTDAVVALKRSLPCFEDYGESSKSYSNSKGVTAAGHHLMEHKSGSSKKKDNSKATISTTLDSRKDSCFSTLSGSNIVDDKDSDELNSKTSIINSLQATSRLLQSSQISEDTSSNNSDKPARCISGIIEEDSERRDESAAELPTEIHNTGFCKNSSDATSDSLDNIDYTSSADSLPELIPPPLSLPQISDMSSLQTEAAENSSLCLKHDQQTDQTHDYSLRAEGEIDSSHLASVHDILNKLESDTPRSITDIDNNVITQSEQSSPDTGDGDNPSSHIPTNSDSPARYFKGSKHDPDAESILTESSVQMQDENVYKNQPVTHRDYFCDMPNSPTDDVLPIPSCLRIVQTSHQSSQQMEVPENSLSCNLDPTHQTDKETLHPSFTPFRADGEVDYSHLASVSDVHKKFEWLMSETSDQNVTKI